MFKTLFAASAACFALLCGTAQAAAKPDLAIYGQLPSVESVEISPDGTKLAFVATNGDERFVVIRQIGGSILKTIYAGAMKLRGVEWAGRDHLLVVSSRTAEVRGVLGRSREYLMALDYNVATGQQTGLLRNQAESMNVILDWPMVRMIDGRPFAFVEGVHFVNNYGRNTLYRIDLDKQTTRMLDFGSENDTDGWLVDASGQAVAQSLYNQNSGRWGLKIRTGMNWRKVDEAQAPMGSYGLSGFGRDGQTILVWRTDEKNNDLLREYRADGQRADLPSDIDLSGLIHDPQTLALLGGYKLKGDDLNYTFFDPEAQKTWNAVVKAFGSERISLSSWSQNRRKVVVLADSATEGPAYALVDLDARKAEFLVQVYKNLAPELISPVRSIKYKAADGLEISGYLTLPRGKDPKNLPLIVLPHGGPEGRDAPGFDWWSQALASRGYAVLQPNFRGSEGFGWDFVRAGFGEWGKKMQTDLSDGVHWLAKEGTIDPKRVCIVGASYGGYAALAGATLDRGVYRCAVSVAGPSDLKKMLLSVREAHNGEASSSQRYWLRFMGAEGIKDPDLAALSPAKLADKVEIPLLLIHGKDDTVVRYDQSQTMADAMKKAGKPVSFVTLDGEDHWLSRGATRLKMLTETVAFVENNNPPD